MSHKHLKVVRLYPPQLIQEKMKIDAIISDTLVGVLDSLNDLKVERKDIVNIFQNTVGQYIAVFYS